MSEMSTILVTECDGSPIVSGDKKRFKLIQNYFNRMMWACFMTIHDVHDYLHIHTKWVKAT
jgi:hypothetical protein